MKYLFDTDILIDHLRGFRNITEVMGSLEASFESASISTITAVEIFAGIKEFQTEKVKLADELLLSFNALPPDYAIAKSAGRFRSQYQLELGDAVIAATAYMTDTTLVTRNLKHFQNIKEIKIKSI